MKVGIAAGGTGGHIIPALAVVEALRAEVPEASAFFIGAGKEIEAKLIEKNGFKRYVTSFGKVRGANVLELLKTPWSLLKALTEVREIFKQEVPDVLIGFGGYPSVPAVLCARLSGVPCLIHEQNVEVGLASKFLSLFALRCLAVLGAQGFPKPEKVLYFPNPVRKSFEHIPDWAPPAEGKKFTLLIMGGSQGAVRLNDAALSLLPFFKAWSVQIIHQTGSLDFERMSAAYAKAEFREVELSAFIEDLPQVYARTHLVISRAGAMSVAEVSAAGRPAIYVPLVIAGGHQAKNVTRVVAQGGAELVKQTEALATELETRLKYLLSNPQKLEQMARAAKSESLSEGESAATKIAREIISVARTR